MSSLLRVCNRWLLPWEVWNTIAVLWRICFTGYGLIDTQTDFFVCFLCIILYFQRALSWCRKAVWICVEKKFTFWNWCKKLFILIQIFVVLGDGTINGLLSSIGGKMTKEAFELVLKKFNIQVIHYFSPL